MTATSIPALLEPIQARLNAATPGPWEFDGADICNVPDYSGPTPAVPYVEVMENRVTCGSYCYGGSIEQTISDEDKALIANAPTDTARLLAAVKAVVALHPREVIAVHEGYGEEAVCPECQLHYPCPTVSAVEAALRCEA